MHRVLKPLVSKGDIVSGAETSEFTGGFRVEVSFRIPK